MTKTLLLTVLLVALAATLCHANPEESMLLPVKRDGAIYKRVTEELYRLKRQSGTMNWDLNQMYDLFSKVKNDMKGDQK